ncbi:MAG: hypothetical protein K2Y39_02700 [Candidatus Obscuribacterales bacterium]|nr:hypothetical protein [Candidatus Obscuribacterales bacterium]
MLTRRSFLLGSLISWAAASDLFDPAFGLPKLKAKPVAPVAGPHTISRAEWPPAIIPDFASVANPQGFSLFCDEFGRMSTVDLRRPGNPKTPVKVLGELSGLGKKVFDFTSFGPRAYALVALNSDPADLQLHLVTVNVTNFAAPSVVSKMPLREYAEFTSITSNNDLVCIAGTSLSGENLVTLYQAPTKGRATEPALLASFSVPYPVAAMDVQDRTLVVLNCAAQAPISQLDIYNIAYPRSPQAKEPIKLEGEFKRLARVRSTVVVSGRPVINDRLANACEARTIFLDPAPRVVSSLTLEPLTSVLSAAAQRDRFLILGETRQGRKVLSIVADKTGHLTREQVVNLPTPKGSYGQHASIVAKDRNIYVSSGWAGVEMLTGGKEGWTPVYTYSIPRLPASGVASWNNMVVLGGSDLKLYDISNPDKPSLISTQDLTTSLKAIVGAGSYILCLSKDGVALRKMDSLGNVAATLKTQGSQLCYDPVIQKAFVIAEQEKKSIAQRVKVYSNKLEVEKNIDLPKGVNRGVAQGGYMLCAALNDLYLYGVADNVEQFSTRHFENLAPRDFALTDDYVIGTFVDQQTKGFFLVLSKDNKDMHVLGSVDLPHDGTAVAVQGKRAITAGRTPDGKSIAAIVDFTTPSAPRIVATLPVVESASAISIKDRMAIVVGRGLELLSLM